MNFEKEFCDEIRNNIADIKNHIQILNEEGGEIRDRLGLIEGTVGTLKDSFFKGVIFILAAEVLLKVIR